MFENDYAVNGNGKAVQSPPHPSTNNNLRPALLEPQISLFGCVSDDMFWSFKTQLASALRLRGELCLELSTTGGDAETGRRIAEEIRICREYRGRNILFFGKTFIYSAGVTIMAGFPKEERYLSKDCHLLIHSRRMDKEVHFIGPLSSNVQVAEEVLANLKSGLALEHDGFKSLAEGCELSFDEIKKRAAKNWYLTGDEALELGMVHALL